MMNVRIARGGLAGVALCLLAGSAPPAIAQTGTLKMQFVYGGDAPKQGDVNVNKDIEFCGKHDLKDETLIVNPENKGIKNVVVYVYTGRGGTDLDEMPSQNATHVLANQNCRFEPRYVVAQAGDTLKVTNPDLVGHNANINFFRNQPINPLIPAGGEKSVELTEAEPAPIQVDCNIHPWMRAYVLVLDHPFAAVSDENGVIEIEGLPTGKELTFRVYHEAGKIDEVSIDGDDESWRRSRFETTVKAGLNDMGEITVPADALKQ